MSERQSIKKETAKPWRLGLGAELLPEGEGVRFRVWAPNCRQVEVVIEGEGGIVFPLRPEKEGYFSAVVQNIAPGALYRYRLDGKGAYPDPCSRFQPQGPHGPSMVVDPNAYRWGDPEWRGIGLRGQVIYELHVGTFTPAGTLEEAASELEALKDLGITVVELMPLAEFPGRWNWGYDGVDLFAPAHVYGAPDSLKYFIDRAHRIGLGVILDVVYNHFGPDGNYMKAYSDGYFTDRYQNEWGEAINFDGPGSGPVREFFIQNACYWIAEFHFDGLRLDATQCIYDSGIDHVLAELSRRTRAAAGERSILITSENEPQEVKLLAPQEKGGYGLDALWSDDFHHTARVALTGRREAYYTDYKGEAQELLSLVKRGFLYQGQHYQWQNKPRGTPVTSEPAAAFVFYIQNHDQVANHPHGERIQMLAGPSRCRAMTTLLLLAPETPLLFMGQEFAASSPFLYFADQPPELGVKVYAGRKEFLAQFPSYATPEVQKEIPDPAAESTFLKSKLNLTERESHGEAYRLHQDLLRLRRNDPVIGAQAREQLDGAVFSAGAFVLRFFGLEGDRLLLINLGADLEYAPAPEPLLVPPPGSAWELAWSSDDPRYGGSGKMHPYQNGKWRLPGGAGILLSAEVKRPNSRARKDR